jgi:hypothetical protein
MVYAGVAPLIIRAEEPKDEGDGALLIRIPLMVKAKEKYFTESIHK